MTFYFTHYLTAFCSQFFVLTQTFYFKINLDSKFQTFQNGIHGLNKNEGQVSRRFVVYEVCI